MLKVNNKSTRKRCEISSKLIIKAIERHHWHRYGVSAVKLSTYFTPFYSASVVDFEQVIVS